MLPPGQEDRAPLNSDTFKAMTAIVPFPRGLVTLLRAYRPGSSPPTHAFFSELVTLLEQFAMYSTQLVFVGDRSLHLENMAGTDAREFGAVLRQFSLA